MKIRILNNYRVIYKPKHPLAMTSKNWKGFIYEHIYIAHKFIKEYSTDKEVHHLDENPCNNRIENLLVLSKEQHQKIHHWFTKIPFLQTIKTVNLFCKHCGITLQHNQKHFCSTKCKNINKYGDKGKPTKTELSALLKYNTWTAIGKQFNVSDNAVRKWAKKFNLL